MIRLYRMVRTLVRSKQKMGADDNKRIDTLCGLIPGDSIAWEHRLNDLNPAYLLYALVVQMVELLCRKQMLLVRGQPRTICPARALMRNLT